MKDISERLEIGAEEAYSKMLQPDGKLKCRCGKIFDATKEGSTISSNLYAMPVCENCFLEWRKQFKGEDNV